MQIKFQKPINWWFWYYNNVLSCHDMPNMPWYAQFGKIPIHDTKSKCHSLNVLTVHSIIVKNTIIFMHMVRNFLLSLPFSARSTIPITSPSTADCNHENSSDGYQFGIPHFRHSLFFKEPLLSISRKYLNIVLVSPTCLLFLNIHKNL